MEKRNHKANLIVLSYIYINQYKCSIHRSFDTADNVEHRFCVSLPFPRHKDMPCRVLNRIIFNHYHVNYQVSGLLHTLCHPSKQCHFPIASPTSLPLWTRTSL